MRGRFARERESKSPRRIRLMLVGESKPSVEIAEKKLMFFGGTVPWCSLGGEP